MQSVEGRNGSLISGPGFVALWDGRNNTFSPSAGFYFSYSISTFSSFFGSNFNYTAYSIDARKYYAVKKNQVLAFQFVLNNNIGTVPVRSLSNIGSNSIMRGYYEGRYTDKNFIAAQVEHRFPVVGRFGMVVFAAMGRVGYQFDDLFKVDGLKPSLGSGLRYAIDKKEKLNARLDFGIGQRSNGFYFNLTEVITGFVNWLSVQFTYLLPKSIIENIAASLYKTKT